MVGIRLGLHLPDIPVADELVVHRHPGLGRLALREEAHFRFARVSLEFHADNLDVQVRQAEVSARFHVPQDGGADGFVIVDASFLASSR